MLIQVSAASPLPLVWSLLWDPNDQMYVLNFEAHEHTGRNPFL